MNRSSWWDEPVRPIEAALAPGMKTARLMLGYRIPAATLSNKDVLAWLPSLQSLGLGLFADYEVEWYDDAQVTCALVVGVQLASAPQWERSLVTDEAVHAGFELFTQALVSMLLAAAPEAAQPFIQEQPKVWLGWMRWAELFFGVRASEDDLGPIVGADLEEPGEAFVEMVAKAIPDAEKHMMEDWETAIYGLMVAWLDAEGGLTEVSIGPDTLAELRRPWAKVAGDSAQRAGLWLCERTGYHH